MGRANVDERGFELVRRMRRTHAPDLSLAAFKALVRDQFLLLLIDEEAALAAIPAMLPADADTRRKAFDLIKQVMSVRGELSPADKDRMQRVERLFSLEAEASAGRNLTLVSSSEEPQAKAS
jgi:hypothetical protein